MENSASEYFMGNFEKISLSAKVSVIVVFFLLFKSQGQVMAHLNDVRFKTFFISWGP